MAVSCKVMFKNFSGASLGYSYSQSEQFSARNQKLASKTPSEHEFYGNRQRLHQYGAIRYLENSNTVITVDKSDQWLDTAGYQNNRFGFWLANCEFNDRGNVQRCVSKRSRAFSWRFLTCIYQFVFRSKTDQFCFSCFMPNGAVQPPKWSRPRNDPQPWNDPQIDPEMIPTFLLVDSEMIPKE